MNTMNWTAKLFLFFGLPLSSVVAKPTKGSLRIDPDDLKNLIDTQINDRLADATQCPNEQYWDGRKCDDCVHVCHVLDRHCLQTCPVYVLKLNTPDADTGPSLATICALVLSIIAVVGIFVIVGVLVSMYKRSNRQHQGKYDSQQTSVESSVMSVLSNQQHVNNGQNQPLLPTEVATAAGAASPIVVDNRDDTAPAAPAASGSPVQVSPSIPDPAFRTPISSATPSRRIDQLAQIQPESDAESIFA